MVHRPTCMLMVLFRPDFAGGLPSRIKAGICERMYGGTVPFTMYDLVHTVTW